MEETVNKIKKMKRKKLQALCKKKGICANIKSKEMIEALIDIYKRQWRPWDELQSDALDLILNHFQFKDLVRLSPVCKYWRKTCQKHPNYIVLKWPWLVTPQFPSNESQTLNSPMKSLVYSIDLSIPTGYECFGHSMGWLVIHHATRGYFLLNPLKETIFLKLPDLPNNVADSNSNFFERAIVFEISYSLAVAAQAKNGGLYLCRPEDERWDLLIEDFYGAFVFSKRWLYCVGLKGYRNVIICYEFDVEVVELWKETIFFPEICSDDTAAIYLVMSTSRHLLLVERKYDLLVLDQDVGDVEVEDVGDVEVEDVGDVEVEDVADEAEDVADVEVGVEGDEAEDVADVEVDDEGDEADNEGDEVEDVADEGEDEGEDDLDEVEGEGDEIEDVANEDDDEVEDDGDEVVQVEDEGEEVVVNTTGFRVFMLDYDRWVRVEKLGKDALFISAHGESCARALTDDTPSGYKANCIYFTDMKSGGYLVSSDGHYDQGEYSLEDGKIEKWFQLDVPHFPLNTPYWFFP